MICNECEYEPEWRKAGMLTVGYCRWDEKPTLPFNSKIEKKEIIDIPYFRPKRCECFIRAEELHVV